jgi:hypothetical protein
MSLETDRAAICVFIDALRRDATVPDDDTTVELLWRHGIRASSLSTDPDHLWYLAHREIVRENRLGLRS